MDRRDLLKSLAAASISSVVTGADAHSPTSDGVYELRVYHLNEGTQDLILDRFRTRETGIFERCGMHGIAYWIPVETPLQGKTLVYMLRHKSREAAKENWAKFSADPEWIALKAETEKNGPFVKQIESTFLKLTDFSPQL